MRVKAIRLGYYNHQRKHEGSEFSLEDEKHFSEKWMMKLDGEAKPKPVKKKVELPTEDVDENEVI